MTKNQLIIKAFQDLDADMLDLLLDGNQPYQEVSKDIFVTEVRKLFSNFREDENLNCDLKKIPGECDGCNKGQKGFAFVNKDNLALMELLFEEEDGKITDICPCSSFKTEGNEYDRTYRKFSFYEEDKRKFKPSYRYYQDVALAERGIKEIEEEIANEGILSASFCLSWFDKYSQFDNISEMFTGKSFKFKKSIQKYINVLRTYVEMVEKDELARTFLIEFFNFEMIDKNTIAHWLIRCNKEFDFYKFGLELKLDFRSETYKSGNFVFDSKPFYHTQNIGYLLNVFLQWILEESSISEIEEDEFPY